MNNLKEIYSGSSSGKDYTLSYVKYLSELLTNINLQSIESNLNKIATKKGDAYEINLSSHKILGTGEVKNKLIIKAKEASQSAIDKVKKAGGEIQLPVKKVIEKSIENKVNTEKEEVVKPKGAVEKSGDAEPVAE